jgi:hypothetical protein
MSGRLNIVGRFTLICMGLVIFPLLWIDSAAPQTTSRVATIPLVDAWRKCAMDKAGTFLKSGEPAETVAKVALYECRDQRALAWEGMLQGGSPANVVLAAMEKIEADMRDLLVSLIVQAKSK